MIRPIDIPSIYKYNPSFGIYKGTHKTYYGFVDNGVFKNYNIDIYHAFNDNGTLKHKLYYVTEFFKWVRSKLKFYKEGKCYYTTKGQAK